jgi:hypothetical protein
MIKVSFQKSMKWDMSGMLMITEKLLLFDLWNLTTYYEHLIQVVLKPIFGTLKHIMTTISAPNGCFTCSTFYYEFLTSVKLAVVILYSGMLWYSECFG